MLLGSAQTRSVAAAAQAVVAKASGINNASFVSITSLETEGIERRSGAGHGLDVSHCAECSQSAVGIIGRHGGERGGAHPASNAGVNGDVLLAVGAGEGDGVADDSGTGLELPEDLSGLVIDGAEPALQGAVEDKVAAGGEYSGIDGQHSVLDVPDLLLMLNVPRNQIAVVAAGARIHAHAGP